MKTIFAMLLVALIALAVDGTVVKTPDESIDVSVDFAARASSITLISCTSYNTRTHLNSTAAIIAASPAPAVRGTKVICRVQGGRSGEAHNISIKVSNQVTG